MGAFTAGRGTPYGLARAPVVKASRLGRTSGACAR
nr:UxaA family hydrolase [Azospirillum soli]